MARAGPGRSPSSGPTRGRSRRTAWCALQGLAIATSGDYRNFYEQRRPPHQPRDRPGHARAGGAPAGLGEVVHEECLFADAMATALFVLGPERGLTLARERDCCRALHRPRGGGALRDLASPAFAALA